MKTLEDLHIGKNWDSFLKFRNRQLSGIQTGIVALDKALLGLGALTVIQGAPKCHKSTLALQIVHHNLKLGFPTLYLDRENGLERFRSRLICQANRVSRADVLTCPKERLREFVRGIVGYPLYICTQPVREYEEIKEAITHLREMYKKPVLLVADSLQALPRIADEERISHEKWLAMFDQLKLDFEGTLTILVTSEKRRGVYGEAVTDGAKGTGNAEYKGETILDMRRDSAGNILVDCVENRDGPRGQQVVLKKVFCDPYNPASFTFLLEEAEEEVTV